MPRVVGIDVGLVNMALCAYDTETKDIFAEKVSLVGSRRYCRENDLPYAIAAFVQKFEPIFNTADLVVIEVQMRRKMLIIQHSLCSYLLALRKKRAVRFVHPRAVRKAFGISMNSYAANKRASILALPQFLTEKQLEQVNLKKYKKKDDICEAVFHALYGAKFYDNLVRPIL